MPVGLLVSRGIWEGETSDVFAPWREMFDQSDRIGTIPVLHYFSSSNVQFHFSVLSSPAYLSAYFIGWLVSRSFYLAAAWTSVFCNTHSRVRSLL